VWSSVILAALVFAWKTDKKPTENPTPCYCHQHG